MRANFFELPKPELPRRTINLPTFGEVVLERISTASAMRLNELTEAKLAEWGPGSDKVFLVGEEPIALTRNLTATCAGLAIMQRQTDPYSFEELVNACYKSEDEFNLLSIAANELNSEVMTVDPKSTEVPPKESSGLKELA